MEIFQHTSLNFFTRPAPAIGGSGWTSTFVSLSLPSPRISLTSHRQLGLKKQLITYFGLSAFDLAVFPQIHTVFVLVHLPFSRLEILLGVRGKSSCKNQQRHIYLAASNGYLKSLGGWALVVRELPIRQPTSQSRGGFTAFAQPAAPPPFMHVPDFAPDGSTEWAHLFPGTNYFFQTI